MFDSKIIRSVIRTAIILAFALSVAGFGGIETLFTPKAELWERWIAHQPGSNAKIDHSTWDWFLKSYVSVNDDGVNRVAYSDVDQAGHDRLDDYIESPQVDVAVAGFRSKKIYVTGAVGNPGTYPITNLPMRLVDAISAAGGISDNANWSQVILTRDGKEFRLSLRDIYENGNAAQNVLLRPGDVVNVSRAEDNKIFVLGEVSQPQSVPMGRNGMSLAEALSDTGGLDEREADASGIFVFRKAQPGQEHGIDVYQLNAKDAAALVLADSFQLQPRDIVYVTAAPLARWNRVLSLLVPSVTALYLGSRAEDELGSN